jgi:intracellular sulfur oxidation DsrE/DsrF family protein
MTNRIVVGIVLFVAACVTVAGQEKSTRPGVNDPFQNPDVETIATSFGGESREVFARRAPVVAAGDDFVSFTSPAAPDPPAAPKGPKTVAPVVPGYGAVVLYPDAAEQPAKGTKVVFDVTATAKEPDQPLPGLVRAATLLNLAGAGGLKPSDVEVVIVLHGDATAAALGETIYKDLFGRPHPHADLMTKLKDAGVKFLVCGQSMARKGYDPRRLRTEVTLAASAVTATINLQARGFAYVPAH